MAVGPVQLLVLGFNDPDFHGEVIAEVERLRRSEAVRVIDALAVYKDADGRLRVEHLSNDAFELDGLVGLGIEDDAEADFGDAFSEHDDWDVIDDIPTNSAAAIVLLEHRWAVPLCNAIVQAGYPISDGFITTSQGGNDMFGIRRVARYAAPGWR